MSEESESIDSSIQHGDARVIDDSLSVSLRQFFTGQLYELARRAIIRYETLEFEGAQAHWIEMRDAVEHVRQALLSDAAAEQRKRFDLADEHLRRAAAEATQEMVEARIERVRRLLRYYWLRRTIYPALPSQRDVTQTLADISHYLDLGRERKANEETFDQAITDLGEAHRLTTNLFNALQSHRRRFWINVLVGASAAAGIVGLVFNIIVWSLS